VRKNSWREAYLSVYLTDTLLSMIKRIKWRVSISEEKNMEDEKCP
jgi:hypothetical protein